MINLLLIKDILPFPQRLNGCLGKGSKTVPILKLINTNIEKI